MEKLPDCVDTHATCLHKRKDGKCLLYVHIPNDKFGCEALRFPNAPERVQFT